MKPNVFPVAAIGLAGIALLSSQMAAQMAAQIQEAEIGTARVSDQSCNLTPEVTYEAERFPGRRDRFGRHRAAFLADGRADGRADTRGRARARAQSPDGGEGAD